jgi:hypothetical protein
LGPVSISLLQAVSIVPSIKRKAAIKKIPLFIIYPPLILNPVGFISRHRVPGLVLSRKYYNIYYLGYPILTI